MSNVEADHAAAILALLTANSLLAGKVYDGKVADPIPLPPYVLVYMFTERVRDAAGNSLDGLSKAVTIRAICHCIGADATGARAMAYQVSASLLDVRPTIGTRDCGLIGQESSQQPVRNELTGTLNMDAIDTYVLTTNP